MDIILDSNIFLSDPTFSGVEFVELFAHLRVTGGRLIVSTLVREEVCARYRERLEKNINASRKSWGTARSMMTEPPPALPHVDIDSAVTSLASRLMSPRSGVKTILLDLAGVDINEVVACGVNRKKPASAEGEQLRDVILWLSLLHHAEQNLDTVVFISGDGHFHPKDGGDLFPDLRSEIDARRLPISYYPDIRSFLSWVSTPRTLDEALWHESVSDAEIRTETKKRLEGFSFSETFIIEEAEIDSLTFQSGQSYEISADSSYVEVFYRGTGWVFLTDTLAQGHPHLMGHSEILDKWQCSFLVRISARMKMGRVAAWQVNNIIDLNIPFTNVKSRF